MFLVMLEKAVVEHNVADMKSDVSSLSRVSYSLWIMGATTQHKQENVQIFTSASLLHLCFDLQFNGLLVDVNVLSGTLIHNSDRI